MTGFGSIKKIIPVDEPTMDMILDDQGSGSDANAEVSASPVAPVSRSSFGKGRGSGRAVAFGETASAQEVDDDLIAQFEGVEKQPADVPVAKVAPVASGGIESKLAGLVTEPDLDALIAADQAAASTGNSGSSATAASGDTPAESGPASAGPASDPASEEADNPLDYLRAQNLGNSHEILHSLLRSGLDDELAASYANDYINHFNEFTRDGLERVDKKDKAALEKKLQADERQAARSGHGGGLLSGLLSLVMPSTIGKVLNNVQLSANGNQRRKLIDENSGFADMMTNRIRLKLQSLFAEEMTNVHNSANALARSVVAHNLAVMEGAQGFKQAVELEALATNRTVEEVLGDLAKGSGNEDLRKLMDDAIVSTASDPEVLKAKKIIAEREIVFAEVAEAAAKRHKSMTMNDPSIDPKAAGDSLAQAFDAIEERMPSPLDSPEEKLKFAERMKAVAESMQEAIRALMDALASKFGAKP